jgi:hypothetical protein
MNTIVETAHAKHIPAAKAYSSFFMVILSRTIFDVGTKSLVNFRGTENAGRIEIEKSRKHHATIDIHVSPFGDEKMSGVKN